MLTPIEAAEAKGYRQGRLSGEHAGYERALKELAAAESSPEATAKILNRLHQAEDIVDWLITHFDWQRTKGKKIAINDHYEHWAREQVALRPTEKITEVPS